jgi:drug/metabolite transporter (DMT)-like permease
VAIGFTAPLITVALAVLILKERVRGYRWAAVGVGFIGVLVMLIPHVDVGRFGGTASAMGALGAICGLLGALGNAGTVIQTRRMTFTETTSAIVFYFSLFAGIGGLVTLPFGGWLWFDGTELIILLLIGALGGIGHILLTESYRYAPASVSAPFDYAAMIWALMIGFVIFGEVPNILVVVGAIIVAGAGLFMIWRERRPDIRQRAQDDGPPAVP